MANKSYDILYKLLLIGDSNVGKTEILFRFSDDAYNSTFISTIGIDFKVKTIELHGKKLKLQIWDTAGQERFHTITTSYYRGAVGIMLVYDITNEQSFDHISMWLRNIKDNGHEDTAKILVGNNCHKEDSRKVSKERAEIYASFHGMKFAEISDEHNINIEKAFMDLIEAVYVKQNN